MDANGIARGIWRVQVLLSMVFLLQGIALAAPDCTAIAKYRDTELVQNYDRALQQYRLNADAKRDLLNYEQELRSTALWHTSPVGQMKDQVVQVIGAINSLIDNLLKLNPETELPAKAVDGSVLTVKYLLDGLEAGKDIHELLGDETGMAALQYSLMHGTQVEQGVATLIGLEQQVRALAASGAAADALQATIDQQLSNLDTQLAVYDAAMADQVARLSEIARVVSVLDQLCTTPAGMPMVAGLQPYVSSEGTRYVIILGSNSTTVFAAWATSAGPGQPFVVTAYGWTQGGNSGLDDPAQVLPANVTATLVGSDLSIGSGVEALMVEVARQNYLYTLPGYGQPLSSSIAGLVNGVAQDLGYLGFGGPPISDARAFVHDIIPKVVRPYDSGSSNGCPASAQMGIPPYMWSGYEEIACHDGSSFVGYLSEGERILGTTSDGHGMVYTGQFKGTSREGGGVLSLSDGTVVEGKFANDVPVSGHVRYPSGDQYTGGFTNQNLTPQGDGAYWFKSGDVFTGSFSSGHMSQGTYIWANGDVQQGAMANDEFDGQTTITQHDGTVYTGGWSHGHAQGQGTKKLSDGRTFAGNWNNGELPIRSGGSGNRAGNPNPYQTEPYDDNGCEDDPECYRTSMTPGGDDGDFLMKLTTVTPKISPK